MDWRTDAIWWHVYPLGFVDAERTATDILSHRLPKLTGWLDYLVELGANGLLLAPIFASVSHGYDTLDHYRIDPRLGDAEDFADLVAQAKQRGIRVCLDGVFNHLSREHPLVVRALAAGPGTPDGDWVDWRDGHAWTFEGHHPLVQLNLSHPPVMDYIVEVMNHWLDAGVDGWRLDAAYAAGAPAWRPIIDRVRAAHPQAWLLGEVIHGDYAEFVAASGIDTVTQYELWHAIWDSLLDVNLYSLDWTLGRHRSFSESFQPQTFISNHDVTRIATRLEDPRDVRIAAALLLMLPGVPSIYAGDEQGFTGEKQDDVYGDDAVRPPFPDRPDDLLPFGAELHAHYQKLIGIRRRNPWLARAVATTSTLSNTWITIILTGQAGETLTLEVNLAEAEVDGVAAHGWRLS